MGNQNADKLKARAFDLVEKLQAQSIQAEVIINTLRDYSIKVALPIGQAVIYYSPKKDAFKCQQENVNNKELWHNVLACWEEAQWLPIEANKDVRVGSRSLDIYVDGSFAGETTTYAVVVVQSDQKIWEDLGIVPPTDVEGTRQVAGELMAVLKALEWCKANDIDMTTIHYDYQGIEKWATGGWKAKKTVTQQYRDTVQTSGIQITWHKVDAHTGVKWNEHVDQLARSAAMALSTQPGPQAEPITELDRTVTAFRVFVQRYDVAATVKRMSNAPTPHVQLAVSSGEEAWGYLNFYCSKERPPYPSFHELRPEKKRNRMENLWREFRSPSKDDLSEINHYFSIMKPYETLNFDFHILAKAVARIWDQRVDKPLDINRLRYDFVELERCIDVLRCSSSK